MSFLTFEDGPAAAAGKRGWSGEWPPPEKMFFAVGRQTHLVSWATVKSLEKNDVTLASLREHAFVAAYERTSFSELPDSVDSDPESRLVRGAVYRLLPDESDEFPPPMSVAVYTDAQAPGALPNGTRVRKVLGEPGDAHPVGALAKVLGSVAAEGRVGYFVEWDESPGVPVFVSGQKLTVEGDG